jgi:hypothetical protein
MRESRPDWEVYERMIARLIADQSETDLCVTPNAGVMGKISETVRQIDVLIDARHDTDNIPPVSELSISKILAPTAGRACRISLATSSCQ